MITQGYSLKQGIRIKLKETHRAVRLTSTMQADVTYNSLVDSLRIAYRWRALANL